MDMPKQNFVTQKVNRAAVGMGIPMGFPWVWVWDGYGDCNESPWACGNSIGIFD